MEVVFEINVFGTFCHPESICRTRNGGSTREVLQPRPTRTATGRAKGKEVIHRAGIKHFFLVCRADINAAASGGSVVCQLGQPGRPGVKIETICARTVDVSWQIFVIIVRKKMRRNSHLFELADTLNRNGFSLGTSKRGQEECRQDCDNRNDNQQFDERETGHSSLIGLPHCFDYWAGRGVVGLALPSVPRVIRGRLVSPLRHRGQISSIRLARRSCSPRTSTSIRPPPCRAGRARSHAACFRRWRKRAA